MKLTSIQLASSSFGEGLVTHADFSLNNIDNSQRYILKGAVGLDAEEILAQFYARSPTLFAPYYKMVLGDRVISLLIKLNPQYQANETASDLRDELYKAISYTTLSALSLKFMNGTTTVATLEGNVSKLESNLFTSEPEVKLTFKCNYPFLRGSYISKSLLQANAYWTDELSTAPHGFQLEVGFYSGGTPSGFSINNPLIPGGIFVPGGYGDPPAVSYGEFKIDNFTFEGGDIIRISTEDDNRSIQVIRDDGGSVPAYTIDIADKVVAGSIWPIMHPGQNAMSFPYPSELAYVTVHYRPTYWGV